MSSENDGGNRDKKNLEIAAALSSLGNLPGAASAAIVAAAAAGSFPFGNNGGIQFPSQVPPPQTVNAQRPVMQNMADTLTDEQKIAALTALAASHLMNSTQQAQTFQSTFAPTPVAPNLNIPSQLLSLLGATNAMAQAAAVRPAPAPVVPAEGSIVQAKSMPVITAPQNQFPVVRPPVPAMSHPSVSSMQNWNVAQLGELLFEMSSDKM
jgi:hypothetical protein